MTLALPRSFAPMEALLVPELPTGAEWQYEPKWDGFRCLAFRDGDTVDLMSKAGKPLSRYEEVSFKGSELLKLLRVASEMLRVSTTLTP